MKRLLRLKKRKQNRRKKTPVYVQNLEPRQLLSAVMFDGDLSGAWATVENWENDTMPSSGDTATFDGNSPNTAITLSSNTTISSLNFLSGASAYTLSNKRFDIYSVVVDSGVTNDQTVNSVLKGHSNFTATNNGTGDLLLSSYANTSGDKESHYAHTINAQGDITFRGNVTTGGRTFQVTKTGAGTLAYEATFDFNLGHRANGAVEQSKFIINDGTLDISQMTLRFETNTGSGSIDPAALTNSSYVLVDYAAGDVIVDSTNIFGTVNNLPDGFEIFHDTANSQIRLQQIQGIPGQWIGDVSGTWQTVENWVDDDKPGGGETAYFGDLSQTTTISLTSNVTISQLNFMDGALAHTFNSKRFDIQSIIVEDGVTQDQEINSLLKGSGGFTARNLGSADLFLGSYSNTGGDKTSTYTHTIEAVGDITYEGSVTTGGRTFKFVKTGTGTLSYLSTVDFNLGYNGTSLEQTKFVINEGTLDISQMTLKFETNTGSGAIDPANLTAGTYVLVDYSGGGSVITDSTNIFGNVSAVPDGFEIVHDSANSQILLQRSVTGIYVMAGGTGDGSSSSSPLGVANMAALETAWNNLNPGETLYLINSAALQGSNFSNSTFDLNSGGDVVDGQVRYKSLVGIADSNGVLPTLTGTWNKGSGSASTRGIKIDNGVSHIKVENINISHYEMGVQLNNSNKSSSSQVDWDIHITNVHITSVREGFNIDGGAQGSDGNGSTNVSITDSSIVGFEKRGVRIRDGVENVVITNVLADAGGVAWDGERFAIGFEVYKVDSDDAPNRHIYFINTTGQNIHDDNGGGYWNGDGYTAEGGNEYIYYHGAKAFNNTDGGFDVKAHHVEFVNTVSIGNYRNYRNWGNVDIVMDNILSAWTYKWSSATQGGAGIWLDPNAVITLTNSTIHNVSTGIEIDNGGTSGLTQATISNTIFSNTNTSAKDWTTGSYFGTPARISYSSSTVKLFGKASDSLTNTTVNPMFVDADDLDDTDGDGRYFLGTSVIWDFIDDAFDAQDSSYAGLGFDNDQPLP
ncbi:MAG TPA: hypothetical protein DER01_15190 [Phycisphaerales bacterium]|nr:hypothetical protein [Phycisphaerales bacterium]